ncbi:LysR family transcriptional regulator [Stappia sp. F7233]|uniref:LysR family transcriptional regulator n=1 Tax=Stappia albiluteola TaxID=2758565 RepID=A0A839AHC2_9HYPH|nr:LysR family transcriptional regulator [Stappia albiluteola]MBA5778438.1 LysR family transcriptional regulator [Stappia albiluteola]
MSMNIEDMRALVAVVENGSLSQAAAKLHLTQPAITRRLQRLEEALGVTLLDREQKPARPTEQGLSVYRACLKVLEATEDLRTAVGQPPQARHFRLGISRGVVDAVLSPIVLTLKDKFPDVDLDVDTSETLNLRSDLRQGVYDAVVVFLRENRAPDPREIGHYVGTEEVVFTAAHSHALDRINSVEELAGEAFVMNPDGCGFRTGLEHRLMRGGDTLKVAASIWGVPQQLSLIAEGVGLGLIPRRMIAASAQADRLKVIEVPDFSARLAVWVLRARDLGSLEEVVDEVERTARAVFASSGNASK